MGSRLGLILRLSVPACFGQRFFSVHAKPTHFSSVGQMLCSICSVARHSQQSLEEAEATFHSSA
jgi:hypothetical protein